MGKSWACRLASGTTALFVVGANTYGAFAAAAPQVSLAAGRDASSGVSFAWVTEEADASCDSTCWVEVGAISDTSSGAWAAQQRVAGNCTRYTFGSLENGNYTSGLIHKAAVEGLKSGTAFGYRLGSGFNSTFHTVVRGGYPATFGVVGDLGQSADSAQTVRHLGSDPSFLAILHPGDMAYADTNGVRWDTYGELVTPLSSRLQWMVAPGNHEIESDAFTGLEFVPYESRFAMPAVAAARSLPNPKQIGCRHFFPYNPNPPEGYVDCTPSVHRSRYDFGQSFYSFDAGPAHVVVLNPYTDIVTGSAQREWLEADLAENRADWVVVLTHMPLFSSNTAHYAEWPAVLMREELEPLFNVHGVAFVFNGHVHAYERTHQMFRNATTPSGTVYVVAGDGGNREGHADGYVEEPSWSAFRNGTDFGHGKLTLQNRTHGLWEWFVNDVEHERDIAARGTEELPRRVAEDSAWVVNPRS